MKKIIVTAVIGLFIIIGVGVYSYKIYRANENARDYKIYYGLIKGDITEEKEEFVDKDEKGNKTIKSYIKKIYKNQKMVSEKDGTSTYDVQLFTGPKDSENEEVKDGDWFTVKVIRKNGESLGYKIIKEKEVPKKIREELKK